MTTLNNYVILNENDVWSLLKLNIISQFGSACRGSGGSSVKIRRNHHYRNCSIMLHKSEYSPSNTRRYVQTHWMRLYERFWIMKSVAIFAEQRDLGDSLHVKDSYAFLLFSQLKSVFCISEVLCRTKNIGKKIVFVY